MSKSLVVYRGRSLFDPSVVVRAVLVPRSTNRKTGDVAQLYVLRESMSPPSAQKWGLDSAVCGSCPLRPANQGGCYVTTSQGALRCWCSTNGKDVAGVAEVAAALRGRTLRLGAYGDVAALPPELTRALAALVDGRVTGYTHAWRTRTDLARYCMASVHSLEEAREARSRGWRTFRMLAPDGEPVRGEEVACPAESRGMECRHCMLCHGVRSPREPRSITIPAHGYAKNRALQVVS